MNDVHKNHCVTPTSFPALTPTHSNPESDELNEENNVLEAAKEEQDLYDEMFRLSQDMNHENETEVVEKMQEKLNKFKTIMTKKDALIKDTRNDVKRLNDELKESEHNCDMIKEVEERQHQELEEEEKRNRKGEKGSKN